jgi:F-type H+-transporting ATPase subunit b
MSRLYNMLAGAGFILVSAGTVCKGSGGEPEPSVFGGTIWTSIWTLTIFILLLLILKRFAWKPLLHGLKNREDRIRNDLQSAKDERVTAEKLVAEYKLQLSKAQAEAQEMIQKSVLEAEKAKEQIIAHGHEQNKHAIEQAKQSIEQAKQQALKELYAKSAEVASELAAKILQRDVNSEDHRVLIQQGLDELNKRN